MTWISHVTKAVSFLPYLPIWALIHINADQTCTEHPETKLKKIGIDMEKRFAALAEEVEAALVISDDLAERTISAIGEYSKGLHLDRADLDSTDKVFALIHAVRPGWNVTIKGTVRVPNGHWRCTLRESSSRDNDEFLGVARGPTLAHSLLASLLKVLSFVDR